MKRDENIVPGHGLSGMQHSQLGAHKPAQAHKNHEAEVLSVNHAT